MIGWEADDNNDWEGPRRVGVRIWVMGKVVSDFVDVKKYH